MTDAMFAGRTALITGAASGIGAATARALHRQGATRLVLVDRDGDALVALGASLGLAADDLETATLDVSDEAAWAALETRVAARFGGIDCLIAAAGIGHPVASVAELPIEAWRRTLAVNLDGAFLALQTGIRLIRAGARGGAIVLLSSSTAFRAQPGMAGYAVSKSALVQLTRTAAAEVAADKIRVNAIAPGMVETPLFRSLPAFRELTEKMGGEAGAFRAMAARLVPIGRATTADETAEQIMFLLGQWGETITGAVLNADGGMTLSAA